jgi:hypothetical protein
MSAFTRCDGCGAELPRVTELPNQGAGRRVAVTPYYSVTVKMSPGAAAIKNDYYDVLLDVCTYECVSKYFREHTPKKEVKELIQHLI